MKTDIQIAAYYFPNYHIDPRNEKVHGVGWTEWELIKQARSRFSGHSQPRVPMWGYENEADPAVMARKIDAAADHGIDAFIFDWYHYEDGPFLQRALEEGFLGAKNNERLKFAIMLANHDWINIHPASAGVDPELLYPGLLSPESFKSITDYVIENYFKHPSYWKINGCPYFSVYEIAKLIKGAGSVDETCDMLQDFRERVRTAGFPGLHLNGVVWEMGILPGETREADPATLFVALQLDSVTSYVWVHDVSLPEFPFTDYRYCLKQAAAKWQEHRKNFDIPYYPNVTVGWDTSPRTNQSDAYEDRGYPFMAMLNNNTPTVFRESLSLVKEFLLSQPSEQRILTINAWNEWTEGSYLEPDSINGMGYLEKIKELAGL